MYIYIKYAYRRLIKYTRGNLKHKQAVRSVIATVKWRTENAQKLAE